MDNNLADALTLTKKLRFLSRRIFPVGTARRRMVQGVISWVYRKFFAASDPNVINLSNNIRRNFLKETTAFTDNSRDPKAVKNILLIKVDHIGDFVIGIPAFELARKTFPNAKITLLCGKWNIDLAKASGLFDEIVSIDFFPEISAKCLSPSGSVSSLLEDQLLALPYFDIAIDLKVEDETRLLLRYVDAGYKAGFDSMFSPFDMTFEAPRPHLKIWDEIKVEHHTRRLLYMLMSGVVADYISPESVRRTLRAINLATDIVPAPKAASTIQIAINLGAGSEIKRWPITRYAALADWFSDEFGATIVLFGAKSEKIHSVQFMKLTKATQVIDNVGKLSLLEFTSALKNMALYIGNDTGTTHLAAGLDVATICLFSGGGPIGRFSPIGSNLVTLYHQMPCAPCGLKYVKQCSFDHACMRGISLDDVKRYAKTFLEKRVEPMAQTQDYLPSVNVDARDVVYLQVVSANKD